LKTPAETNYEL